MHAARWLRFVAEGLLTHELIAILLGNGACRDVSSAEDHGVK
jgi:hypothetical protein